jgi:putative nucleotidyltransferase with HDIG domain
VTPRARTATNGIQAIAWIGIVALVALYPPSTELDFGLFAVLLVLSVVSDLLRIQVPAHRVFVSASFLAIITAAVFLGPAPAAAVGVLTTLGVWLKERYAVRYLVLNATAYALFPLLAGIAFHEVVEGAGLTAADPTYFVLVFALFVVSLLIDFVIIGGYTALEERVTFAAEIRRAMLPILPSELASAMLTVAIAIAYAELGLAAMVMFAAVVIIFQYLVGALLLSQERAEELQVRARQLAGFQVSLLSALLRALDLRDRMTARHSAAVARYSREIAAAAGLPADQQELVHTAALLHDIGKFVLPDSIVKSSRRKLTDEEWEAIRRHPAEGAALVSQIDGYTPISEIILAHHERIDGAGYPRGISGDDIPLLSRVISVADTYDVITARDSYRKPMSSHEAIEELRRVSGTQLDERYVEVFAELLRDKNLAYRHGEDADFEAELAGSRTIHDYIEGTAPPAEVLLHAS